MEAVETMVQKGKWTVPGTFIVLSNILIPLYDASRLQGEVWRPFVDVSCCCNLHRALQHIPLSIKSYLYWAGRTCLVLYFLVHKT